MNTLDKIVQEARADTRHIVLPEADDPRIVEAACEISRRGIARISLVAGEGIVEAIAQQKDLSLDGIELIDNNNAAVIGRYGDVLFEARRHKGISKADAEKLVQDPLLMAAAMVRAEDADGMVAGATHATAEVVRSALQMIGMKPGSKIVSSFFIMQHELPHQAIQGTAIYADCGMVIDPNADELACIAMDSADSAVALAGIDPTVALLSFSTAGSAEHPHVTKVREAGAIIATQRPDIKLMTEVQFDAAIMPQILKQKAPAIDVAAPANVFIFPDLQSGNIGYKIAQRIGGVQAIGPILQGLNKPINDLSRGCSVEDIVNLVAFTAVQTA